MHFRVECDAFSANKSLTYAAVVSRFILMTETFPASPQCPTGGILRPENVSALDIAEEDNTYSKARPRCDRDTGPNPFSAAQNHRSRRRSSRRRQWSAAYSPLKKPIIRTTGGPFDGRDAIERHFHDVVRSIMCSNPARLLLHSVGTRDRTPRTPRLMDGWKRDRAGI